MANWQRKLNLLPEWDRAKDGQLPMNELAGVIAARLGSLAPFEDEHIDSERDEIVDDFKSLATDVETTQDDLDELLDRLYDWADTSLDGRFGGKKVCWVQTF